MTTYNRLFDEELCVSKYGFTWHSATLIEHRRQTVLKSTLAIAQ